ncbi:MAG: nucleotidyltransferase domain-containing protein [Verrucomicrobiota bacterium]|nr:nucleotidyltransferase domain-containing protein [Verrucomicrobiota bacterium]
MNINLLEKYILFIKTIFDKNIVFPESTAFIFGSRATGSNTDTSDIDIALKGDRLTFGKISLIKEDLENSSIPYKIDLVNYSEATEKIKNAIDKEGVLIWTKQGKK